MKTPNFSHTMKTTAVAIAVVCGTAAYATTLPATTTLTGAGVSPGEFTAVAFSDSAEAGQLRQAYQILATGDHDYKGHRVQAMHAVERAGKLLGIDLAGDLKDRSPQKLSDERLREAQNLITQVLGAASVKNQKRVAKNLNAAVAHINTALSVR